MRWTFAGRGPVGDTFTGADWDDIRSLLEGSPVDDQPGEVGAVVAPLLDDLIGSMHGGLAAASQIRNQLLDIWSAVHQLDPKAAGPVEDLLGALVGRDLVQVDEVEQLRDQVLGALGRAIPR